MPECKELHNHITPSPIRDHEFDTLDEICNHFNVNRAALETKMATQGFEWSEQQKKFW
jgi:hypothetical protein